MKERNLHTEMKASKRSVGKRALALLLVFVLLLSASGCMGIYLLSEQLDPNGTWLAEGEPAPTPVQGEKTPPPAAASEGQPAPTPAPYVSIIKNDTGTKFADMVYTRPDTDAIDAAVEALEAALADPATDAETLLSLFQTMIDRYNDASDAMSLAYVLYSMDVTDEYYQTEQEELTVLLTEDDVAMTDVSIALFDDPRTKDIVRERYGEDFIRVVRDGRELNRPEIQPYIEKEQKLISKYDTLITTFVYKEKGKTYTMEDIAAFAEANYDEYARLYNAYYAALNREAGEIFLELVKLRNTIAETLGFDNYTDYQYRCYNRDYTPADAQNLHTAVKQHIVPLYFNGILTFYLSEGYDTVERISITEQGFYEKLREELKDVSPEALEAFDYMMKNELYTTTQSDVKMEASYSTYLGGYDAPFLFTEWTDDISSAATIMHELGHFTRFCVEPADSWSIVDPLDILEIDSQGLEMMLVPEYEDFYGEAGEMVEKEHLLDGLYALITGCMEDEFQQIVYADPDMTLAEMNTVYAGLAAAYGMTDLYGFTGTEWAVIPHTFQSPLYYISYAVSVVPALELYVMAEDNADAAAATYARILHRPTFTQLREVMSENGLSDPLSAGTIRALAAALQDQLVDPSLFG